MHGRERVKRSRGRKAHQMVTGAEARSRHRTPGSKRFQFVDGSMRGIVGMERAAFNSAMMYAAIGFALASARMRRGAR